MHSLYLHKKARQQHQQPSALPEGRADVCNISNQSRSRQLIPAVHCGFLGNWTWNKVMSGTGFYQINLMMVHTWEKNKPWRILLTVRANNIPPIYFGNWRVCCLLMISDDIFPLKPSVQAGICRKYNCACYALFTQGHSYVLCRQMKKKTDRCPEEAALWVQVPPCWFLVPRFTHMSSVSTAARLTKAKLLLLP